VSAGFWIKRFFIVLLGAFVIITAAQMLKGREPEYSLMQGAVWGAVSALVFTVARYFQSHRGQHCAVCRDTPEMRQIDNKAEQAVEPDRARGTRAPG
jgi:hypothetical protein